MIRLHKLAKKILEKRKERLYGKSEFKPMKPLFKNEEFNAYMSALREMPHADYGLLSVDLGIEKYKVSIEVKQEYMRQYQSGGLFGYVHRYRKWLKISDGGIRPIKSPPTDPRAILPDDWEKYIKLDI